MNIQYRRDLWNLIEEPGPGAEIGVAEGNFSRDILSWPEGRISILYMVDRWKCVPTVRGDSAMKQEWHERNLLQAREKASPFGARAVIMRGESVEMAASMSFGYLSFLYIDADHSFEGVTRDLEAWVPRVRRGGVVALHDYESPQYGVKKAVTAFCAKHNLHVRLIPEDKPEDAGAWFRVC